MGTSLDHNQIAFTCECNEPEGLVLRTVKPLSFTPENLNRLYSEISKFRTFMGQEIHSMDDMLRFFLNEDTNGGYKPKGLCMVVDDFVGLFWLTDINGLFEASVHYTFFDRRHRGRVELCKKAIEYTFNTFKFHRLFTAVPVYEIGVLKFIESIGFVKTGRNRKNRLIRGKYYDTCLYDLLQEEFLNGNKPREL